MIGYVLLGLLLLAAVGAACYYAGWRSARAYLYASSAISELTNAVAKDANSVSAALDKFESIVASLRESIGKQSENLNERQRAVEEVLTILFNGFERAQLVRRDRPPTGRQVGEKPGE